MNEYFINQSILRDLRPNIRSNPFESKSRVVEFVKSNPMKKDSLRCAQNCATCWFFKKKWHDAVVWMWRGNAGRKLNFTGGRTVWENSRMNEIISLYQRSENGNFGLWNMQIKFWGRNVVKWVVIVRAALSMKNTTRALPASLDPSSRWILMRLICIRLGINGRDALLSSVNSTITKFETKINWQISATS